jgi:hypothetical protein
LASSISPEGTPRRTPHRALGAKQSDNRFVEEQVGRRVDVSSTRTRYSATSGILRSRSRLMRDDDFGMPITKLPDPAIDIVIVDVANTGAPD